MTNGVIMTHNDRVKQPLFRPTMTDSDVDEINDAERRALDWQAAARRRPSNLNIRMAKETTEECLTLAAKFDCGTVVLPFAEVAK